MERDPKCGCRLAQEHKAGNSLPTGSGLDARRPMNEQKVLQGN